MMAIRLMAMAVPLSVVMKMTTTITIMEEVDLMEPMIQTTQNKMMITTPLAPTVVDWEVLLMASLTERTTMTNKSKENKSEPLSLSTLTSFQ